VPTPVQPDIPAAATFEAIPDPIERAAALTTWADALKHRFPPEHAALRRAALVQARMTRRPDGQPYTLVDLAQRIGVHFTRIFQLTTGKRARPNANASDLAEDCAPPAVLPTTFPGRKTAVGGDANMLPAAVTS
jgi:hypothetical protein